MASGGHQVIGQDLVKVGELKLKPDDLDPIGLVVVGDKLLITDWKSHKVHVYRRHDGMLLSSTDELESSPICLCCVSDMELCVAMIHGIIEIMSVQDSGLISRGKTFDLRSKFDYCGGVALWNDNIVVSGVKDNTICWCIVCLKDGRPDKLHKVCEGNYLNYLTVKQDMVYITCQEYNGVYGFNLLNPNKPTYTYKHEELGSPSGITVTDFGHLFVCDKWNSSIHHLTGKCELVTIYKNGLPRFPLAIFWDSRVLYLTSWKSNKIKMCTTPQQGTGIPVEILNMDDRSIKLFENALKDGKEKVYSIRVMVVGHQGVGKTTLIKRLLGKDVNISERQSTEGIDVHLHCCDVSLSSHEWTLRKKETEQDYRLQRLAKVLIEKQQVRSEAADEKQVVISHECAITDISAQDHVAEEPNLVSRHPDLLKTSQQIGSPGVLRNLPESIANTMVISEPGKNVSSESRMMDPNMEILQLLQKHADKIKHDPGKYAPLTMWDFAGQYAFYTTHQMFLSRRAIYLLVSDLSGHIDDIVDDEIYFDKKGKMECRVGELVEVWMNYVHSCAPPDNEIMNSKVIPPPVILVGTHADAIQQAGKEEQMTLVPDAASKPAHSKKQPKLVKLFRRIFTKKGAKASKVKSQKEAGTKKELDEPQTKDYRHEICENYFRQIRSHLKDKPSRFHLVEEEFDIDNTIVDSKLEGLKRKIVEVASRQPYWGEEIPAKWLPLEQVLTNLRAQGYKVIHRSLLENINQAGGVQVSTDELDLFLRFQHEIGTILFFSTELLKEKIVLEPRWMINALKSLITTDMFVLRNAPSVTMKWDEFKNGKLYPELIDALWTKDADLHDNKDHILLLMEELNIIAKPKLYIDDESEIKEVNYLFAPCMLHEKPPREVIFPEHHEQMESSSVMCYVFTGKCLPAPIFHRLLAACVAKWPLATKKTETTLENQIFCGCGVFQIDDYHKLTLHFSGYIIFMRVTRQGIKDKTPSSKLCIDVKEFIAKVLNKLIGYLGHNLRFEEFIQCPEYNGESVNSLIPVSQLKKSSEVRCDFHCNIIESNKFLKFWFEDQGQTVMEGTEEGNESKVSEKGEDASMDKVLSTFINKGVPCSDPKLLWQLLQKSQQAACSSQSMLKANCLSVGLVLHGETPADGNCFFEAVSSQLRRLNGVVQKSPQELRQEVVAFMRTNRVIQASEGTIHLDSFIYNESFDVYCSRMARDGEWADHVVVVAMARMLKIDIMIVTSSPLSGPEHIVWVVGQTSFQEDPILLGHIWESHYMSLQPIAPVVLNQDLASHSTQAQTDVSTPSPTAEIMQISATGSTSSTTVGFIQASTTNATPSLTSITAGVTQTTTSSFIRTDLMQASAYGFTTAVMQAPTPVHTKTNVLFSTTSASTPSTTTGSTTCPTPTSTTAVVMQDPSSGLTASVIQTTTSGSTAANVIQTPTSGSTAANVIQTPTSGSTAANVIQTPTSGSTAANVIQPLTSGSTAPNVIQNPTLGSTAANVIQAPTSGSTAANVIQTPTSGSTAPNVIQTPTSGFTAANVIQTPTSGSTAANVIQTTISGSTAANVIQTTISGSTAANVIQTPTSGSTAANVIQTTTSGSTTADVTQAPSLDDTGRFVHIACLLVNVGSKVIRRLLHFHTVSPSCTLDQYLAKKRIDIDNLRKRKILNKSQMDILFPPAGSTNLGDYDITLLSALFTNIVLTISHQDLNMIQSLRDKRNEIFAHAKSVTVNSNDYQTFWNDICRTLEALSKQCNDPDFENEISREIQGIQVSTVQGTSLLDTLQTHRKMETLERLVQYLMSSHAQELNKESDDSDS